MKRRPKIIYNGITLTLSIAQRPWDPASQAAAGSGSERTTSGVGESWTTRRDEMQEMRWRCMESEWPALHAFIAWAQATFGTFTYFPDADMPTSYTCDLVSPANGEKVSPSRGQYTREYEFALTIRAVSGAFHPSYY